MEHWQIYQVQEWGYSSFAYGGAIFASTFYFATSGDVVLTLLIYFLAQFGATGSNVFYDSVLKDITTEDTIDQVSAREHALGYLGGGLLLFITSNTAGTWDIRDRNWTCFSYCNNFCWFIG